MSTESISSLLQKEESELLAEWYRADVALLGQDVETMVASPGELRDDFLDWIKRYDLRHKICDQWSFCERANKYQNDTDGLVNLLVPFIAQSVGLAPTVSVIPLGTVLLVKFFLRKLCECD